MNLPQLCIQRPVMTVLLSVACVLAGWLAYLKLPVAALPSYNTPVISVTAQFPGASPETMAASVALPLEKQFSTIDGISVISSTSILGATSITLEFNSNKNIDLVAVDVQAALLRAQRLLPVEMTNPPSYRKVNPADAPVLFVALNSPSLSLSELNDYAENLIAPTISTVNGVALVNVNGQKRYAVRVKANPDALAAHGLTLDDVVTAINSGNSNTPVGILDGPKQLLTITANRQLYRAAEFADLVVTSRNGVAIKVRDVAQVEESFESVRTAASYNGERSIILSIQRQPNANTVAVIDEIKALIPKFRAQLPASIQLLTLNDRSLSIREAIHDVKISLGLTIVLVVLVILVFIRRLVATLIPTLSLPVSLIGAIALLHPLGYSLDNISLLGITLAVGLVVDDAIVMLENIMRHVEEGMAPLQAALVGSREMAFTIFSISISLVAVFIPIFFMPGVIGLLFHEFAVVVGLSVLVSAVVSLTLVPMLASRFLKPIDPATHRENLFGRLFERAFKAVLDAYAGSLDVALRHRRWVLGVAFLTFGLTVWLVQVSPKGFFPEEDIGQIQAITEASEDISFEEMSRLQARAAEIVRKDPNVAYVSSFVGSPPTNPQQMNTGRMFIVLKPLGEREKVQRVIEGLRQKVRYPGFAVYMRPVQNLQLGGKVSKSRYQYVMQSVSADALGEWSTKLMQRMRADPTFRDVTSDTQMRGLQAQVEFDRDKAGALGVYVQDIRNALYSAFGDRQVSTIFTPVNSYLVILEAPGEYRKFEDAIGKIFVRSRVTQQVIPLSTLVKVSRTVGPTAVNHQGQLQAVTISFNLAPDAPLGEATKKIEAFGRDLRFPPSIITSYGGDAAVFQGSQSSQLVLILVALAVIYVLLGVLYESYIHPLTILAGLPSAAVGALVFLWFFKIELTLIATIGILMLIGIVKKNAIMMIDFALEAQRTQSMTPEQAIRQACVLRFRPILMTTFAALMGALPIALGLGAGAELRMPLGVAVVGGLLFSQVITLYITPVIYLYLDRWAGKGPLQLPDAA
ncbi:MAG: efflux RND transporter permease subunit [Betaproteobacteria bacterium]|nr:efflux RND transporter permease subunit [Betaproteobacteria bacterium]